MRAIANVTRLYQLEVYRGDSFQVYVKEAGDAMRLLLQLRAAAKSIDEGGIALPVFDIRAAIGIGTVKTPVKDLRTATGNAFILSGKSLDALQKPDQRLVMVSGQPAADRSLRVIAYFIDYLMERMTIKQALVVYEMLNGQTQAGVAKKLKKSQATVNQHLQAAGWQEIEKLLEEYGNLLIQLQ